MTIVDIHTIGAGGGSLALRRGRRPARRARRAPGADPGPACYGRGGTRPTVTDANLVLGRVDPDALRRRHDGARRRRRPRAAVADARAPSSASAPIELAEGILDVINAQMAQAIRTLTVEQGIEPRDFALVAFGGAGPMHAVFLARELEIARGHRARRPGRVLRLGHAADARSARTSAGRSSPSRARRRSRRARRARCARARGATGVAALDREGVPADTRPRRCTRVDLRYVGQEYTLTIPLDGADDAAAATASSTASRTRFPDAHETRYGHANPGAPIELVVVRTTALGDLGRAAAGAARRRAGTAPRRRRARRRLRRAPRATADRRPRDELAPGTVVDGPAIVIEQTATTVVPPGATLVVDALGALVDRDREGGLMAATGIAVDPITIEMIRNAFIVGRRRDERRR